MAQSLSGGNCVGAIHLISGATNLADDGTCGASFTNSASINLGSLGNNGGTTQTVPILAGSSAIDAADAGKCPSTDQRGYGRNGLCDIGAFEFNGLVPVVSVTSASSSDSAAPATVALPPTCANIAGTGDDSIRATVSGGIAQLTTNIPISVFCGRLSKPEEAGVNPFLLASEISAFTATTPPLSATRFSAPITVCLKGSGKLLFRDANASPRVTVEIASTSSGGYTCGTVNIAGTLILVAGSPSVQADSVAAPEVPLPTGSCRIETRNAQNLRAEPSATATVINILPVGQNLPVTAKSGPWLKVVYGSTQGWLLSTIADTFGTCQ